jgi:hypothetical protein
MDVLVIFGASAIWSGLLVVAYVAVQKLKKS